MSQIDISKAREVMGISLGSWANSPKMSHEVHAGSWHFLSGVPSPAVNMALVSEDSEDALNHTLDAIAKMRVPSVLFLASEGKALSSHLPKTWNKIGFFTLMTKEFESRTEEFDALVSLVTRDNEKEVAELLAESFHVASETYSFLLQAGLDENMAVDIWVREVEGVVVSTVNTTLVGDTVALWCMATPSRYERRGYGKALFSDVLARSMAKGARSGVLCASSAGKPIYEANGWMVREEWDVYVSHSIDRERSNEF